MRKVCVKGMATGVLGKELLSNRVGYVYDGALSAGGVGQGVSHEAASGALTSATVEAATAETFTAVAGGSAAMAGLAGSVSAYEAAKATKDGLRKAGANPDQRKSTSMVVGGAVGGGTAAVVGLGVGGALAGGSVAAGAAAVAIPPVAAAMALGAGVAAATYGVNKLIDQTSKKKVCPENRPLRRGAFCYEDCRDREDGEWFNDSLLYCGRCPGGWKRNKVGTCSKHWKLHGIIRSKRHYTHPVNSTPVQLPSPPPPPSHR